MNKQSAKLTLQELCIFALLGALMFASKKLMEVLPNVHLLGMFIVAITVVYRVRALFPIYIYVLLDGLFGGFFWWWTAYLYIWAVLWGAAMLLPKEMYLWTKDNHPAWLPAKFAPWFAAIVYAVVAALHGFSFGLLYAPVWAIVMHLNWDGVVSYLVSGAAFDTIHGVSNFIVGFLLTVPFARLLHYLKGKMRKA